jgi:branched-chain amino acid transport system ATP-binding protein
MLELERMSCGYGPLRAVNDLSLQVKEGSICALIGPNGAGKSSTIMAIAGHVQVFEGEIRLARADLKSVPAHRRAQGGIALVPEGRRLFPDLTVRENLVIGGLSLPRAREAANLELVLTIFPQIRGKLERLAGTLSGGEQQMVAISRALMLEPKLLMIDEVSLGLMPKAVDQCYAAILQLKNRGIGVLLVEQSTERAFEVSDTVVVLESGRKVWEGPAAEARGNQELISAYLGLRPA